MAKSNIKTEPVKKGLFSSPKAKSLTAWIVEILIVIGLAALFSLAFCSSVTIQEASMDPTLQSGDHVLVNRLVYGIGPVGRGDLIAYRTSDSADASVHVKRVIGLPGENIQIKDGLILINGKTYMEDKQFPSISNAGLAAKAITLGTNEYFVLGDSRNNSEDSRFADVGNISRSKIIGKVWFITVPSSRIGFVK
jgi:signal peptidase I